MDNRTKRLYIVVPLLWVVLIGAAAGIAYVRHSAVGEDEHEEEEANGHAALAEPAIAAGGGALWPGLEPNTRQGVDLFRSNQFAYLLR